MSAPVSPAPRGLPAPLPEGERLLWQGAPEARAVLFGALRLRWVAGYFALMIGWTAIAALTEGASPGEVAVRTLQTAGAGVAVVALLALYAWAVSRTTVYTVTSRRVVIRHGVALAKTFNVPFRQVVSAGLKIDRRGVGDLPLALADGQRIAFVHLWPHARPWRFGKPEPMLRAVPDAAKVADLLAAALRAAHPTPAAAVETVAAPAAPAAPRRPRRTAAGAPATA